MKKIMKIIPVLALVIGAGMAFAGATQPDPVLKEAFHNGEWIDITGKMEGQDYLCVGDENPCTRERDEQGEIVSQVSGVYTPLP